MVKLVSRLALVSATMSRPAVSITVPLGTCRSVATTVVERSVSTITRLPGLGRSPRKTSKPMPPTYARPARSTSMSLHTPRALALRSAYGTRLPWSSISATVRDSISETNRRPSVVKPRPDGRADACATSVTAPAGDTPEIRRVTKSDTHSWPLAHRGPSRKPNPSASTSLANTVRLLQRFLAAPARPHLDSALHLHRGFPGHRRWAHFGTERGDGPARQFGIRGRPRGEKHCPVLDVDVVDGLPRQTALHGPLTADYLTENAHRHGSFTTTEAVRQSVETPAGQDTTFHEAADQPRIARHDAQIARQRQVEAGANCRPAHCSDAGHPDAPQPQERRVDQRCAVVGDGRRGIRGCLPLVLASVRTRTERPVVPGDHQCRHGGVRIDSVAHRYQFLAHREGQAVLHLRVGQRHYGHTAVDPHAHRSHCVTLSHGPIRRRAHCSRRFHRR